MAKSCDKGVVSPLLDLNHDILSLVMMQLGVVDFVSFSGVCKSWRSLALSDKKMFLASKPPMSIWIEYHASMNKSYCYLEDFKGRKFKTLIPHSTEKDFVGLTCGYLILFKEETSYFWLMNPITKHQLYFPNVPSSIKHYLYPITMHVIVVLSPSKYGWLFVITKRFRKKIWFSIGGKGVWNLVSTTFPILDLQACKGKIYTLNKGDSPRDSGRHLCEMTLGVEPKLVLLETTNFPITKFLPEFVSLDENLYLFEYFSNDSYKIHRLDFGKMKWVYCEKVEEKYAICINKLNNKKVAVKRELWGNTVKGRKCRYKYADLWYFPVDCLNVSLIDEC